MAITLRNPSMADRMVRSSGITYYRQTAEFLKEYISQSKLQPGDKLPSFRKLAKTMEISQSTLDRALRQLDQEGMIDRQPGRGIFITDRLAMGELAIVMKSPLMGADWPRYRMAYAGLVEAIHEYDDVNLQMRMHSGSGSLTDRGEDFAASLDLSEPDVLRRLRGVFTFHGLYGLEEKLEKAGVPVINMGNSGGKYVVVFEHSTLFHQALEHLSRVGCRGVGLLWNTPLHSKLSPSYQLDRIVSEQAESRGIRCRKEWISSVKVNSTERVGYEMFMRFWQQPERPGALIIPDDVLCKGVLRAILHLGLDLPGDLQLITNANKGIELPYHKSVTRVEFDTAEQVRLAAEMMIELLGGKTPAKKIILLPGKLIVGQTTFKAECRQ